MARSKPRTLMPLVLVCLLCSGAGSLVLEVVWSRLLKLVFGSTTLAVSTILVAYMLGLGLGGLLGGKLSRRVRNGVRVYGLFEIGVALYALAVPFLLDLLPGLQRSWLADLSFWPAAMVRFVLVLLLLLLPTLLMGATLPVLVSALVVGSSGLARRAGLLYGVNTLGAVLGTVGAAFLLFPALGVRLTNVVGAGLDLVAGVAALALGSMLAPGTASPAGWPKGESPDEAPGAAAPAAAGSAPGFTDAASVALASGRALPTRWSPELLLYSVVGFTALAYEVCWTRVLASILGSSMHAFAIMLATFLAGIALGSLGGARVAHRIDKPMRAYAFALATLGVLAFVTVLSFGRLNDLFLLMITWTGPTGRLPIIGNVVLSAGVMLPPALVLGALFPLVSRALATGREDSGRLIGDIYFVNTIGSAAGAFTAGFVLLPLIGLRWTLAACVALNLAAAAAILMLQREWSGSAPRRVAAALAAGALAVLLFSPPWNREALTRGVYYRPLMHLDFGLPLAPLVGVPDPDADSLLYFRDGLNATVSVHGHPTGPSLRVNGKPDASLSGDLPTEILCGHIPMVFGSRADAVLIVGYASGITAGATTLYEPRRVDVAEIEPAILEASRFFDGANHRPQENPSVRIILDDGRAFLGSAAEATYDVISSEPSNPWISGASSLFTREYFALAKRALRPGGRLLQWMQLYHMDRAGLQAVLAALQAEFPHVYGFLYHEAHLDLMLLATLEPLTEADLPRWGDLPPRARKDLRRIGIFSQPEFWSLLRFTDDDIRSMAAGAEVINTDDNMFVELHSPFARHESPFDDWPVHELFTSGVGALLPEAGSIEQADRLGGLALAYLVERGAPEVASNLLDRATACRQSALCQVAETARARDMRGLSPEDTLAGLDRAAALDPGLFEARRARADLLHAMGESGAALQDLDAAVRLRPEDHRVRFQRVEVLGRLGRDEQASADVGAMLAEGLGELPDLAKLWADAAVADASIGRLQEAESQMRHYLEIVPYDAQAWEMLARIHTDQGRPDDANRAQINALTARQNGLRMSHQQIRREALVDPDLDVAERLRALLNDAPDYEPALDDLRRLEEASRSAPGAGPGDKSP